MTDSRLRELERRFRASGAVEDEVAWLSERVRTGEISPDQLALAGFLGNVAATRLTDRVPAVGTAMPSLPDVVDGAGFELFRRRERAVATIHVEWSGPSVLASRRFCEHVGLLLHLGPESGIDVFLIRPEQFPEEERTSLADWLIAFFGSFYATPASTGTGEFVWVRSGRLEAHAHPMTTDAREFLRLSVETFGMRIQ